VKAPSGERPAGARARKPAVVHGDGYYADIGIHVFPMEKFRLVREEIVRRGLVRDDEIVPPVPATVEQVRRVHDREYVEKLIHGRLSALEEAVLELPYSKGLADASFLCAGGSILAARLALERGAAVNLGAGSTTPSPTTAKESASSTTSPSRSATRRPRAGSAAPP